MERTTRFGLMASIARPTEDSTNVRVDSVGTVYLMFAICRVAMMFNCFGIGLEKRSDANAAIASFVANRVQRRLTHETAVSSGYAESIQSAIRTSERLASAMILTSYWRYQSRTWRQGVRTSDPRQTMPRESRGTFPDQTHLPLLRHNLRKMGSAIAGPWPLTSNDPGTNTLHAERKETPDHGARTITCLDQIQGWLRAIEIVRRGALGRCCPRAVASIGETSRKTSISCR